MPRDDAGRFGDINTLRQAFRSSSGRRISNGINQTGQTKRIYVQIASRFSTSKLESASTIRSYAVPGAQCLSTQIGNLLGLHLGDLARGRLPKRLFRLRLEALGLIRDETARGLVGGAAAGWPTK